MPQRGHMSLALLFGAAGSHPASWLHPAADLSPPTALAAYAQAARTAERGLLDLFFIADTPAARTDNLPIWSRFPLFMNVLEPVTLLTALAGVTSHIGLGGTVSTSFSEPYNVARQFASLDHLSGGRAAWNVVTSANDYAARNFGHARLAAHADRYRRAGEFVDVVRQLWDTWDDDAFQLDRASGRYFDPARQHPVAHQGEFFTVHGALNMARPPQGRPVIIEAGASDTGQELAARTAELVFSSNNTPEEARRFTEGLKGRMAKYGRDPSELKVLAGLPIVLADTDAEAAAEYARLQDLVHPDVGRFRLGMDLEADLADLPLDEPIPADRIPPQRQFPPGVFRRHPAPAGGRAADPARGCPALRAGAENHYRLAQAHRRHHGGVVHRRRRGRVHAAIPPHAARPGHVRRARRARAAAARPDAQGLHRQHPAGTAGAGATAAGRLTRTPLRRADCDHPATKPKTTKRDRGRAAA